MITSTIKDGNIDGGNGNAQDEDKSGDGKARDEDKFGR